MFLIERENASSKCHENPTEVCISIESIMTVHDEISRNREKFVFSDISLFFSPFSLSFFFFNIFLPFGILICRFFFHTDFNTNLMVFRC